MPMVSTTSPPIGRFYKTGSRSDQEGMFSPSSLRYLVPFEEFAIVLPANIRMIEPSLIRQTLMRAPPRLAVFFALASAVEQPHRRGSLTSTREEKDDAQPDGTLYRRALGRRPS